MPWHMIFFDTETYTSKTSELGKEQRLRLYTCVYWQRGRKGRPEIETWSYGNTCQDLALFILSHCAKNRRLYLFSANLWFDIRVATLLPLLHAANFRITSFFSHGMCFLMKCVRGHESIQFINIQNIFPMTVKKIGEVVGIPKLEVDFDTVSDDDLLQYCVQDTKIIFEAMKYWLTFITVNDLGCFGVTIPSQAFNAYRHRFMNVNIMIHDNEKVAALERTGYFGGRTECFFIGEVKYKTVYVLDINSQYPYVMRNNTFPSRLRYYTEDTTPAELYNLSDHYAVVANCDLATDVPVYCKRTKDKTLFPIGRFNTTLCTGTFRHAFEHGHIEKVRTASVYSRGYLFKKWVTTLYKLRQKYMAEGNATMVFLVKRLLNCLYGKFGQKSDVIIKEGQVSQEDYTIELYYDENEARWYKIITIGTLQKVLREKDCEAFNSFPAIAAHVTDYARLYLWELMNKAGRDNVYYTDTDSLYVNHTGYIRLKPYIDKTELGKLKLEAKADYFKIYGPKDYVIGEKVILKGVPESAIKLEEGVFKCDMFPGVRRDLQKGMLKHYCIETRTKHLKRKYDKGTVLKSGRVIPFSLQEL